MTGAGRNPALDGVRGVAILLVLLWHFVADQVVVEPGTVGAYGLAMLRLTWSGVDLFFVLSGFLIAGILLDHRNAGNVLGVFYLRRICRIFPPYFLFLALYVVARETNAFAAPAFDWLMADPLPLWTYATFTQNVAMGWRGDLGPHWLGVTWSLAVEEQFYLLIPFVICMLPRRVALAAVVVAFLLAPMLRYGSSGLHTHISTPWRCDALAAGAVLAFLVRWRPFMAALERRPGVLCTTLGVLLAGAALMTFRPGVLGAVAYSCLSLLYAAAILLVSAFAQSGPARMARTPWLVWVGERSYVIYLCHEIASGLMHGWLRGRAPGISSPADAVVTFAALAATLVVAELSYRFIERPAIRYGHRYSYETAAP